MQENSQSDFNKKPFPKKHIEMPLNRKFSDAEMARIFNGYIPSQMEDKWYIHWEDNQLSFYRSWTGFCIYIVRFVADGECYRMISAKINRNQKQYSETNDQLDEMIISYLIDVLLLNLDSSFPTANPDDADSSLKNWSLAGNAMFGVGKSGDDNPVPIDGATIDDEMVRTASETNAERSESNTLNLIDLIQLSGITPTDYKLHLATGKKSSPLDAFLDGSWKQWQEGQNQKNFECKQVLSLIYLGGNRWLFAGLFEVLDVKNGNKHNAAGFEYVTTEVPGLDHLVGRAEIGWKKTFRASYLRGEKYRDELRVVAIRDRRMTVGEFPGFNAVLLSFKLLRTIVREQNASWKAALANVAGVYLITDNTSGKHYIGSAYGGDGIWQRWCQYAKSGHGGAKELKQLLTRLGNSHALKFQFAILEVCDLNASPDFVVSREVHWKVALRSREFGLNSN